jgi:hypothetical protein
MLKLVNQTPDAAVPPVPENQNHQDQAAAQQNQPRQDLNGIPRFSSMNDLLKSLQNIAEKQGVSMDRFRIRPAAADQGQSSSTSSANSTHATPGTSGDAQGANQTFDYSNRADSSLLEKLDQVKRLHQQMALMIASIENDIRAMADPLPKIDKGKQKI